MPRDGTANLIPLSQRTKEERKEISTKAGIASGEARRKKKLLRETLEDLLSGKTESGNTYQEDITIALVKAAMEGDVKAYEVIRDTIGQKPADKLEAEIDLPTFRNDLDE